MEGLILTDQQKEIIEGKVCPYCFKPTEFIDSMHYYSNGVSYGMIYLCRPCDAIVGVHKGTNRALGRLANNTLRSLKKEAHANFDPIWKTGLMSRSKAYKWLSEQLKLPSQYTHIGMFSEKTCEKVITLTKQYFSGRK